MTKKLFSISRDGETLFGMGDYRNRDLVRVYDIKDPVKKLSPSAFIDCKALAYILPDGVEEIGASAFYRCNNLKMVFIPASVEKIGNDAFFKCGNLTIYCEGEPSEGWLNEEPTYKTEWVTTAEDYAFDFHRGGVSSTEIEVKINNNWNPDNRPIVTHCTRERFKKELKALINAIQGGTANG